MKKKKILIHYQIPKKSLSELCKKYDVYYPDKVSLKKEELIEMIPSYHGLLSVFTKTIDKEVIQAAKNLEIISNYGVGFDNIDIAAATQCKILVCNTPISVCEPTAEICVGLLVAAMRNIAGCNHEIRTKPNFRWGVMENLGYTVMGKTLGIIGMGNIGKAVAKRASAFGMKIIYHNRKPLTDNEENKYQATYLSLNELFKQADVISLNTPLTKQTFHLINRKALERMKKTAFIVNTSRGAVIDEQALVDALKQQKIAGAALDVYENEPDIHPELLTMNNVVLTAHMGTSTYDARIAVGVEAANNFVAYWEQHTPTNVVNNDVFLLNNSHNKPKV